MVLNELSHSKLRGNYCHAGRDPASSIFCTALKLHFVPGFCGKDTHGAFARRINIVISTFRVFVMKNLFSFPVYSRWVY